MAADCVGARAQSAHDPSLTRLHSQTVIFSLISSVRYFLCNVFERSIFVYRLVSCVRE